MSTRRDFIGFLGNVAFVGAVTLKEGISRPALAMPKWISPLLTREPVAPTPQHPLLFACVTQMQAVMDIKAGLPEEAFLDWLEGGLRQTEAWKPGGSIRLAYGIDLAAGRDPWGQA